MKNYVYNAMFTVLFTLFTSVQTVKADSSNILSMIELASEQQEIAQQVSKAYFYIVQDLFRALALKEKEAAVRLYTDNRIKLEWLNKSSEFKSDFVLIDLIAEEFFTHVEKSQNSQSVSAEIIELGEALTEVYSDLIVKLHDDLVSVTKAVRYAEILDQQPMQIERLAKYYAAYTAGFTDLNTSISLKKTAQDFETGIQYLTVRSSGSQDIDKHLSGTHDNWKTMKKYYLSVEQQQLPTVVLGTTNKMQKTLSKAVKLYDEKIQEGMSID